jgi:hypothetical protein
MATPGRRYCIDSTNPVNSPTKTAIVFSGTAAIRPGLYDLILGSSAAPADNANQIFVQRFTAAGTTSPLTPQALDPGDPTATAPAGKTATVEPTYTANQILFHLALNQRASHRWVGDPSGALMSPAVAANGLGTYWVNASFVGNVDTMEHYWE